MLRLAELKSTQDLINCSEEQKTFLKQNLLKAILDNYFPEEVNKDLLWEYIYKEFGIAIPRVKICTEHDAPFDFVYHAFMGTWKTILAMGNRTGGKTMNFAIIDLLHVRANDDCEVATLGAITAQALRCYNYIVKFINNSSEYLNFLDGDSLISRSRFLNNSLIEILVATITGVNSPHPQKATFDEIELIPWNILQEAWSMPTSKDDIKGQLILGSTRKFAVGPMQRLLGDAVSGKRKVKAFSWCIWEVMEKLPEHRYTEIKNIFGDRLPVNWKELNGFYLWDDAIDKFENMDLDVWETQWECKKPDSTGLVYPRFSDEHNIDYNFKLDLSPDSGNDLYISEDFGYAKDHPDMISFNQVNIKKETITTFDELKLVGKSTEEIVTEVDRILASHNLTRLDITGWCTDKAGATERADRMNLGLPILDINDEHYDLYKLEESIPAVRKMIDKWQYKMTPNCIEHRQDFMSYKYKLLADGTYSKDPEKKNDHAPDEIRYLTIALFPSFALGAIGRITDDETESKLTTRLAEELDEEPESDTIGGNMDQAF